MLRWLTDLIYLASFGARHHQLGLMTGDFADRSPSAVERTEGGLLLLT